MYRTPSGISVQSDNSALPVSNVLTSLEDSSTAKTFPETQN